MRARALGATVHAHAKCALRSSVTCLYARM